MKTKQQQVMDLALKLKRLFPDTIAVTLEINTYSEQPHAEITAHFERSLSTYANATDFMRKLGAGVRNKKPYENYTVLSGAAHGITGGTLDVRTFPDELPPTCHKVTVKERIPKTQIVDTGEFIEVEREIVVCGDQPETPLNTESETVTTS